MKENYAPWYHGYCLETEINVYVKFLSYLRKYNQRSTWYSTSLLFRKWKFQINFHKALENLDFSSC